MSTHLVGVAIAAAMVLSAQAEKVYRVVPDEASKKIPGWEDASTDLKGTIEGVSVRGSTVLVMNGRYVLTEEIKHSNPLAANLVVRSVNPGTGLTDKGGAVFDAAGSAIRLLNVGRPIELHGITLQNGNMQDGNGGAILSRSTVKAYDCVFANNYSSGDGGAVGTIWGGSFSGSFSNCLFTCNHAKKQNAGGGAFMSFAGSPAFYDCIFTNNVTDSGSGAAVCSGSDALLRGCTFVNHSSGGNVVKTQAGLVADCRFNANSVQPLDARDATVSNCVFASNTSAQLLSGSKANSLCWNTAFTNNTCNYLACNTYTFKFRNCLIAGNTFANSIFHTHSDIKTLISLENCTITKNTTSSGSLWTGDLSASGMAVTNSIIWGNSFKPITTVTTTATGANNCSDFAFIQNITELGTLFTENPKIFNVDSLIGCIKEDSPYLTAGLVLDWMTEGATDLAGDSRILDGEETPALGCYASPVSSMIDGILVVPDEASKSIPGWENASTDLKGTIESAKIGETIYVMNGHYDIDETILVSVKDVTIRSLNQAMDATEFGGAVFDARMGDATRAIRVLSAVDGIRICGCQLINGHKEDDSNLPLNAGGAIFGAGTIYLNDCVLSNNYSKAYGGAIGGNWGKTDLSVVASNTLFACNQAVSKGYGGGGAVGLFSAGSSEFRDCTFRGNVAADGGSAVHIGNGGARFYDCTFDAHGGSFALSQNGGCVIGCVFKNQTSGVALFGNTDTEIRRCIFTQNSCWQPVTSRGLVESCVITNNVFGNLSCNQNIIDNIRNCLVADNTFSGALFSMHGSHKALVRIESCTFAGNAMNGGVYSGATSGMGFMMTNTVFYGNAIKGAFGALTDCQTGFANNCTDNETLQSLTELDAGGLVSADPKFVDAEKGDYRLAHRSPCVDMGVLRDWMTTETVDLDGNPRVVKKGMALDKDPSALPDIGCYECQLKNPGLMLILR